MVEDGPLELKPVNIEMGLALEPLRFPSWFWKKYLFEGGPVLITPNGERVVTDDFNFDEGEGVTRAEYFKDAKLMKIPEIAKILAEKNGWFHFPAPKNDVVRFSFADFVNVMDASIQHVNPDYTVRAAERPGAGMQRPRISVQEGYRTFVDVLNEEVSPYVEGVLWKKGDSYLRCFLNKSARPIFGKNVSRSALSHAVLKFQIQELSDDAPTIHWKSVEGVFSPRMMDSDLDADDIALAQAAVNEYMAESDDPKLSDRGSFDVLGEDGKKLYGGNFFASADDVVMTYSQHSDAHGYGREPTQGLVERFGLKSQAFVNALYAISEAKKTRRAERVAGLVSQLKK